MRREAVVDAVRNVGGSISLAGLTRLAEKKKLNPRVIEGVNYYDPTEVAILVEEKAREATALKTPEGQKDATQAYLLDTARAMLALVRDPREKIDDIQFKIIERQQVRIEELEKKLDAQREATEKALDHNTERQMAYESLKTEGRIKEMAAGRFVETLKKLVEGWNGNKSGVQFTPEQLEELLLASKDGDQPFLTKEQTADAEKIVAAHKAKTNGKAAVATVKNTVETAAGAVK